MAQRKESLLSANRGRIKRHSRVADVNGLNEHEVELFRQKWGAAVNQVDSQNCFDNSYQSATGSRSG